MLIPPFTLPSNPRAEIKMREATVADCILLADVSEARDQAATTMFLDAVAGADSKKWTADDRCFALLWYYVHAEQDHAYRVDYDCGHCGQSHRFVFDLKQMLDTYQSLSQPAYRDIKVRGESVRILPLYGAAMEALELERIGLDETEKQCGADSVEAKKIRLQLRLNELVHRLEFAEGAAEDHVTAMSYGHLKDLVEAVDRAEGEMEHGLETVYDAGRIYFLSPPHECPEKKEVTRCRVRFRASEFIPQL